MKAAILSKNGFAIQDVATPKCGPGQVLVKSAVCGICEGALFRYRCAKEGKPIEQTLIGHEGCGTVAEVGAGVSGFKPGDRVADLCNGTYSEYFVTSPDMLCKIPDGIPFEYALGEPVACFVHASGRFHIVPGDRVAVLGCGFMGLGCIQMAKLQGAAEIVAFDPIVWRRSSALEAGASSALDNADYSDPAKLAALGEFDVVIEAAGVQPVIDMATAMVREHGRIVLVGYHQSGGGMRSVDMKTWNYKSIEVSNGHVRRADEKLAAMKRGLALIAAGKIDMKTLTVSSPFAKIAQAFDELDSRKEGVYKIALTF
jgi:threonine dehydrogenase-like Zn-dependent dehydrogenase